MELGAAGQGALAPQLPGDGLARNRLAVAPLGHVDDGHDTQVTPGRGILGRYRSSWTILGCKGGAGLRLIADRGGRG